MPGLGTASHGGSLPSSRWSGVHHSVTLSLSDMAPLGGSIAVLCPSMDLGLESEPVSTYGLFLKIFKPHSSQRAVVAAVTSTSWHGFGA